MEKEKLKMLSVEELKKKVKDLKFFIGVFVALLSIYVYFFISDYLNEKEIDDSMMIIFICSVGGMLSLFPGLNAIKKELKSRNE